MCDWITDAAVAGGQPSHSASAIASRLSTFPERSNNSPSTARRRAPGSGTSTSSRHAFSGPNTWNRVTGPALPSQVAAPPGADHARNSATLMRNAVARLCMVARRGRPLMPCSRSLIAPTLTPAASASCR